MLFLSKEDIDLASLPVNPSFRLSYFEPWQSISNALMGFPLVELSVTIDYRFFLRPRSESQTFCSSMPSLRILRLQFSDLYVTRIHTAARVLHTFLKSCRELQTLVLDADRAAILLQKSLTGKNRIDGGAPPLRTLELSDGRYGITPELALALNTREMRKLVLSGTDQDSVTTSTEMFWYFLRPDAIRLTELRCHRLTPALVHFLCSFSGLEKLEFDGKFYPGIPSSSEQGDRPVQRDVDLETRLLDAFFKKVLLTHKATLKYLAFCPDIAPEQAWVKLGYLRKTIQSTSLNVLHIPIWDPVKDVV